MIQVFLCLIAIAAVSLFLHLPKRQSETPWRKQLPRIDFAGALLLIMTIFSILFGLDRGSNDSWRSPLNIGFLCATVPLLLAFLAVETRFAVEPFTPGHIIFDKALFACYAQNFFVYAAFTALIFHLPLFFQVALQMSPAQSGASLIPAAISAVVGTLLGGIILKRTGKFYFLAVLATIAATLGVIPIVIAPSLQHGALISTFIGSIISFIPQGMTITASFIAISPSVHPHSLPKADNMTVSNVSPADQAVATACSFLFRSLGAAVGVSLVGVLIQSILRIKLRAALEPAQAERIVEGIAQSLDYIEELPPSLRTVVRDCYSGGVQAGFAMCLGLLLVATLSVFWWRERKLGR